MAANFTVATSNMYNFGHPDYPSYVNVSKSRYADRLVWFSEHFRKMGCPDIMGLQELLHPQAVKDLAKRLRTTKSLKGYENATILAEPNGSSGAFVGLITRLEVREFAYILDIPEEVRFLDHHPKTLLRPILWAALKGPKGLLLDVMVVHFKSKRPEYARGEDPRDPVMHDRAIHRALDRRATEARAFAYYKRQHFDTTDRPLLVLGDINDDISSVTSRLALGARPYHALTRDQKEKLWPYVIWSTVAIERNRWETKGVDHTFKWNGREDQLDIVGVSQHFHPNAPDEVRIGSVVQTNVFNDHCEDKTRTRSRKKIVGTDHGQVVAKLSIY